MPQLIFPDSLGAAEQSLELTRGQPRSANSREDLIQHCVGAIGLGNPDPVCNHLFHVRHRINTQVAVRKVAGPLNERMLPRLKHTGRVVGRPFVHRAYAGHDDVRRAAITGNDLRPEYRKEKMIATAA